MRAFALVTLLLAGCPSGTAPGSNGTTPAQNETANTTQQPVSQPRQTDDDPVPGHQSHKPKFEGDQANYLLATLDNKDTTLAHHRGRVTFVAMWASFCTPCLDELAYVQSLYEKYRRNPKVRVLLVSIDDNDNRSRAQLKGFAKKYKLTLPMLIDRKHELMQKVAPRDKNNQPRYAVPLMVVIDDKFRLRRKWSMDHHMTKAAFIGELSSMVDAALRGQKPPPAKQFRQKLGGFFSKKILKLTVKNLSPHEVDHYRNELRHRIRRIHPGLRPSQLAVLMIEVEAKLRKGGTFIIQVPEP